MLRVSKKENISAIVRPQLKKIKLIHIKDA